MLLEDPAEALGDRGEGLVPGRFLESPLATDQRSPEPIRVVMKRTEVGALGTDEAPAEGVPVVATHAHDLVALDLDREAAGRLAERAGSEVGSVGCGLGHGDLLGGF